MPRLSRTARTEGRCDLGPIDVCMGCLAGIYPGELVIDNPSYDEAEYTCEECGTRLSQEHDDLGALRAYAQELSEEIEGLPPVNGALLWVFGVIAVFLAFFLGFVAASWLGFWWGFGIGTAILLVFAGRVAYYLVVTR